MATAKDVLRIAQKEVGYDRYADPERGTKYGRWYESKVDGPGGYDYGANGVAYCAMFASWVLDQAGVKAAGMPGAYCPSIHHKQTLSASQLQPGDLVLFDWEDDGTDDHIGFVVSNDTKAKTVKTIEGNTSGGKVAERTRAYSTICGGIRPAYDGTAQAGSAGVKEITRELVERVADGWYGNDPERGEKLTAEGYDYQAVKLAVNAYLRGESFGSTKPTAPALSTGTYVTQVPDLNVRVDAGTGYRAKKKSELTADGQKHSNDKGQLNKGTTVTVSQVKTLGNDVWGKIPSGWIALYYSGKTYASRA